MFKSQASKTKFQCRRLSEHLQWAALAFAATTVGSIPNAVAQENEGSFRFFEEIIVTARRREENQQEVPVAVSAMDSEYLRSQNIGELNDLGTQVPSLRISNAGTSTNQPLISLRGQRPATTSLSLDPAVPMYFAEVVITPSNGSNLAMYDLESVQVLKGPQGTLFGRNSTGGALLFAPKAPGGELAGYLEAKVGNYNLRSVEGAVDLPVNDSLQFRLAGRILKRDGYQDNVADNALQGEEKFWDEDSKGIRLSMRYEQNGFSNLMTLAYDENEMLGRVPVPIAFNPSAQLGGLINAIHNGGVLPVGSPIDEAVARQGARDAHKIETDLLAKDEVENRFVSNMTEFQLSYNLTLKNVFGYRDMAFATVNDVDGTALPILGGLTSTTERVTLNPPLITTEAEQFSNEIQLLGTAIDEQLEWIVGAYWYEMKGTQGTDINQVMGANPSWPAAGIGVPQLDGPALMGITQISPAGDVNNEAYGLFGEGTYTLSDQWSVTAGLRQSWDERSVTVRNYSGAGSLVGITLNCSVKDTGGNLLPNSACERTETEEFDSLTWRASLNYTPREGMLMYGSVSTGYRAGGFNLRGTDNTSLAPFDEETVVTYELGSKADWQLADIPVRTNLAIYLQEYSDIQKTQQVATGGAFGTATINAAEAEIKGLELDATLAFTENLTLNLAYSYVDADYDEWDLQKPWGINNSIITLDVSDSDFTFIPEQSLTAAVSYTIPVDKSLGEMSVLASVYWQDEMKAHSSVSLLRQQAAVEGWVQADLDTALKVVDVDAYSVVNLRFDWRNVMGSDFDLAAFVNNANDEEYVVGGLNVIETLGYAANTMGAPRTFGASLRYKF